MDETGKRFLDVSTLSWKHQLTVIRASTRFPGITVLSTVICIELKEGGGDQPLGLFWENEPLKYNI